MERSELDKYKGHGIQTVSFKKKLCKKLFPFAKEMRKRIKWRQIHQNNAIRIYLHNFIIRF